MRRIVHYYPDAMGNSGVTFALWSWARAQVAAGYDVTVLHGPAPDADPRGHFVPKGLSPGLTTQCVPHRGRHRLTLRPVELDRYLGRNDLLVLHEGWVPSNMIAANAACRARVPYVVMPHGVYEPAWRTYLKGPRWLRTRLERRVLERAAAVHVFFDSEIADIRALAPRATFIAVPVGFEVPHVEWSGGGGYLSWIGRIDPCHKGLDVLVRALARLTAAERPLLRIRGYDYKGGAERLRHVIDAHGLSRWVRLEGAVAGDEKLQFLREADGYVHPSRWECMGIALLENLALGVPCLVSSVIHLAPMLGESRAAVLAPPREDDLASALRRVAGGSCEMARRGRAFIENALNWKTLIPQFDASLARLGLN